MTTSAIHNLIGIGFGPSNLALAIALAERNDNLSNDALFLERQDSFRWHGSMLLDGTTMQISFLKDLVSLRNPRSRFSFINYLHESGRLSDFINLQTFFPTRLEFNDYLSWCARAFDDQCRYGQQVTAVTPVKDNRGVVTHLEVSAEDHNGHIHTFATRNLSVGIGGRPNIPEPFQPFAGDDRVIHSNNYLRELNALTTAGKAPQRIAVVGAGQSAAEIYHDLHNRYPHAELTLISRANSMKPSDDSPFVNEIFNPEFTDYIYEQTPQMRSELMQEYRSTNYSVVDMPLLETLFQWRYEQKITGRQQLQFLFGTEIETVSATTDALQLQLKSHDELASRSIEADLVILATGYRRDTAAHLLEALTPYLAEADGDLPVNRHYELQTKADFAPRIFVQGGCEATHGLSDTLLSVLAARSREIVGALDRGTTDNSALQTKRSLSA